MGSNFGILRHSLKVYENGYQPEDIATIIDIVKQQVKIVKQGKPVFMEAIGLILDKTIFHPQGGGQPSDKGSIDDILILAVKEDKLQADQPIYHFLSSDNEPESLENLFTVGQVVKLKIDEQYRKKCSISHTAGHLIADILEFNQSFSSYLAFSTQGHHFPGGEYIKVVMSNQINNKEQFINDLNFHLIEAIKSDLPIISEMHNGIRHIKIGNSSRMCGGTHLSSTKDIISCTVNKIKTGKIDKDGIEKIEATIYYSC